MGEWRAGCHESCASEPPERAVIVRAPLVLDWALQIAADVGRWCSGWASGVVGGVDR